MPVEQLPETVETLAADEKPPETLPERTLLGEQLREQGFRDLMEDFSEREISANRRRRRAGTLGGWESHWRR